MQKTDELEEARVLDENVAVWRTYTTSGIRYDVSGPQSAHLRGFFLRINLKLTDTPEGFSIFESDITTKNETLTPAIKLDLAVAAQLNEPEQRTGKGRAELALEIAQLKANNY